MWQDDDDDSDTYTTCANCGRKVFAGVSDCPYCLKDSQGRHDVCSHCGAEVMEGVARCPECGKYTDGAGPKENRRIPRIFVIAGWLVVAGILLPLLLALLNWLN